MSSQLERLALVLVDLDGTLTSEHVNTWFEFTRYVFIESNKDAMSEKAVALHGQYYSAFRSEVNIAQDWLFNNEISQQDYNEFFDSAYKTMQEKLFQLWSLANPKLTKKFVQEVVQRIIDEKINPEAQNFICLLQELCKLSLENGESVQVYVLTGAFSEIAEMLATKLNLSGGYANSRFIYDDIDGEMVFTAFEHDHNLAENKVDKLFDLVQNGNGALEKINPRKHVISIGDGMSDDEVVKYTYGIALNPKTQTLKERAKRVVSTLDEAVSAVLEILPSQVRGLLPERFRF